MEEIHDLKDCVRDVVAERNANTILVAGRTSLKTDFAHYAAGIHIVATMIDANTSL